ncbi:related to cytochrome P450 monooxygenase (lovA) [Ramularia collo-cygni]|uniref:Related to cytochrome P450 monooxygenase (LovA) n=1 Tax=Ramularia collo-cygni TaxID=112498 RepID=A0A2D3V3B5_9PEZI|nr:related to cytochrome P450 monooxygenase (lovA) [Ramularia collo-cygni]CZT21185.1 related to cytochrome P450 monooxygenase (lovA) [Ramularia collo-cygni]
MDLPFSLPVIVATGTALLLATAIWIYLLTKRVEKPNLRVFEVTDGNVVGKLEEAYRECPDEPFLFSMAGMSVVVLPVADIETIRTLPETDVSIKHHHYNVFLGEYSYMGTKADEFDATMRHTLTRNTPVVLASFTAEVEYAMKQCIGEVSPDSWKPVKVRGAMSRVASLMSGRAFVGLPLSRDPIWVEATVNYTQDVSRAWMKLIMLPWPLRPIIAPFLKEVRNLLRQRAVNEERLAPLIEQKRAGLGKDKTVPGGDMIEWFMQEYENNHPTPQELGRDQLLATFASIYNLSNALSYIIYDLAGYPDFIAELRQEVIDVVGEGGRIDKATLPKLRKLDSFARESQRMNPPSLVNIPRVVTNPKGLRTASGHIIPKGNTTTIRAHPINQDPKLWKDPSKFDGLRFEKLRQLPENAQKYQHSSTGVDNINFGHGIWACPGRFFAAAEIRVVMAYCLMNYDLRVVPGEQKPGQVHYGLATLPDGERSIEFRQRTPEINIRWE